MFFVLAIISNIFSFLLFYESSSFLFQIATFVCCFYYFYLLNSDKKMQGENKYILYFVGIFNLFFNLVSGIFALLAADKISLEEREKKPRDRSFFLKLGSLLIVIAFFLFLENSSISILPLWKVFLIFVMGGIFLMLTFFAKTKLKEEESYKLYYLLCFVFLFLGYLGIGKYGVFGSYFSLFGAGRSLYLSTMFFLLAVFLYFIYFQFKKKENLYFIYASFLLSFFYFFTFFHMDIPTKLLLFVLIVTYFNLQKKEKQLFQFMHIFLYFLCFLTLLYSSFSFDFFSVFLILLEIVNLFVYAKNSKNRYHKILAPTLSFLLITKQCFLIKESLLISYLTSGLLSLCLYHFLFYYPYKKEKKLYVPITLCFFFYLVFLYINSFFDSFAHLGVVITLVFAEVMFWFTKKETPILWIQNILRILLMVSIVSLFHSFVYAFPISWFWIFLTLVFFLFYQGIKEEKKKNVMFLLMLASLAIGMAGTIFLHPTYLATIFVFGAILVYQKMIRKKDLKISIVSFLFLLWMINSYFYFATWMPFGRDLRILFGIFVFLGLYFLQEKNSIQRTILLFAFLLPFWQFAKAQTFMVPLTPILKNSIGFYLLWLFSKSSDQELKEIFLPLFFVFLSLSMIFEDSLLGFVYLATVCLITILRTYGKPKSKNLYYTSLTMLWIVILYSLKDVFLSLGIGFYLFLFGIFMIGYALYQKK